MPSDGVAIATLFVIAFLGVYIWQACRLERRVEEGFARVAQSLGEVEAAVGKLVGAVVPPPTTPTANNPNPIHEAPPALEKIQQSLEGLTRQMGGL